MSTPHAGFCVLALVGLFSTSFDALPDRAADCVVFDCGYSWGQLGNNVCVFGEENPDEMVMELILYEESPFPSGNGRSTYPCGTDLSGEMGFPVDWVFASGASCEAVGVPVERIGDEGAVCGLGDDDDSAR
jgi:hypothetical protein